MALTDTAIRSAKAADKPKKLADAKGLYLLVTPAGCKWWRFDYRFGGKRKTLSFGVYPDVPLAGRITQDKHEIKGARDLRDAARELIAQGIDPGENRKAMKAARSDIDANSFEVIGREWFAEHSQEWAENHRKRVVSLLERDIFPWIGALPIMQITPPVLLTTVRRIKDRGALETAHRALQTCGQVFRYAVSTGRAERDPTQDLRGALPSVKGGHFSSVTEPKQVAPLLRALDAYQGTLPVRCALQLAPLVFVRPGELRTARWSDIDLDEAEWRYVVTKTDTPHIVPLATQSVAILRELHPLTGHGEYVFPSARHPRGDRPMSDNAILSAMRRMGIDKDEMSGHGFRAMARTILDEVLGVRPDLIEHQLAHAVRDANGRAYNRTAHLPERRKMMQQWADYLDKLKAGAVVIKLRGSA